MNEADKSENGGERETKNETKNYFGIHIRKRNGKLKDEVYLQCLF